MKTVITKEVICAMRRPSYRSRIIAIGTMRGLAAPKALQHARGQQQFQRLGVKRQHRAEDVKADAAR